MKRTGSIGSWVGPLVTMARRPDSAPSAAIKDSMAARISAGSAIRPRPNSLQAMAPSLGPTCFTPRAASLARLSWVAPWCHIRTFIAGAISTGLSVASKAVVARSSAMPLAILAMMSALAGATTSRSAARLSWICPISLSSVSEKRSP